MREQMVAPPRVSNVPSSRPGTRAVRVQPSERAAGSNGDEGVCRIEPRRLFDDGFLVVDVFESEEAIDRSTWCARSRMRSASRALHCAATRQPGIRVLAGTCARKLCYLQVL
jgi:hypothetical protein